jgi:hypothetical protein
LLFGANTPWKRVRLTFGFGTSEASFEMKSSASNITCGSEPVRRAAPCILRSPYGLASDAGRQDNLHRTFTGAEQ